MASWFTLVCSLNIRPYQINVMFHGLFTFSGWPGRLLQKVYYETTCITKITMIAKYLEDTTSVHSQLANSTFLSHTLSCLCFWQQQLLNLYKYLAIHALTYQPLQLYLHHTTVIMWFTLIFYLRFGKRDPAGSVKHKINLVWPKCNNIHN